MWQLIGHNHIQQYLTETIERNALLPAYLFVGPKHIGKMTAARQFVKHIFCEANDAQRPCLACSACTAIEKEIHPDVWVHSDSSQNHISIDIVRSLITKLSYQSLGRTRKIALVDSVEQLTPEAANALLKTLEEPTAGTVIIFTTADEHALPKTLRSRMTMIRFRRVPEKQIEEALRARNISSRDAHRFAQLSEGIPGKALNFANDDTVYTEYAERVGNFLELFSENIFERFQSIEDHDADALQETWPVWKTLLHDLLLLSFVDDAPIVHEEWRGQLQKLAANRSPQYFSRLLQTLLSVQKSVEQNIQKRFVIESFYLQL